MLAMVPDCPLVLGSSAAHDCNNEVQKQQTAVTEGPRAGQWHVVSESCNCESYIQTNTGKLLEGLTAA